jgi:hypothetical protein
MYYIIKYRTHQLGSGTHSKLGQSTYFRITRRTFFFFHRLTMTTLIAYSSSISHEPYIDRLPYETLANILSIILSSAEIEQIFSLMHVSRRFRVVVQESGLWQKHDFCFSNLLHYRMRGYMEAQLITILLSDKYFAQCLQRRKIWTFENSAGLLGLVYAANWFLKTAETVVLRQIEMTKSSIV